MQILQLKYGIYLLGNVYRLYQVNILSLLVFKLYSKHFNLLTNTGPNKHNSAVTCLQFNTRFVITSSDDGTVKLWDVKTGNIIFSSF